MLMEIIKPIKRKITIDNGERIVRDFWIRQKGNNNKYNENLFLVNSQVIELVKLITRKTIYIQTNRELDYNFIECLNHLWTKDVNIYIITNKLYNSYKDTIVGKALIRFSDNIKGDLILIDANTTIARGLISNDAEFNNEKKYFNLSTEQVKECYEMFMYKFWKKTDFECIDEQTFISPVETQEAPFDIFPKINSKSIILDDYVNGDIIYKLDKLIIKADKSITLIINNIDIANILIEKIAEKRDGVRVEIITKIQRNLQEVSPLFYPVEDYSIYASENELFPMIIFDNSLAILFTEEIKNETLLNSFCIVKEDIEDIEKIIRYKNNLISNDKTYYYSNEDKLKNITSESIITDITKLSSSVSIINEIEEIKGEPEICKSLIDLYNKVSEREININNKYSKIINYSYDLTPKYRDSSLNKDKLYDTWRDTYSNMEVYSKDLVAEIELIINENSSILSNVISLFNSKRVNTKQTLKLLKDTIIEISNREYSIAKLKEFDTILKKSYDDYVKLNYNIEEMKDYKEQKKNWEEKKSNLDNDLKLLNNNILSKEKEINELENSLLNTTVDQLEEEILSKEIELIEIKDNLVIENKSLKLYFEEVEIIDSFLKFINTTKMKKKKEIDKAINKTKETVNNIFKDEKHFDNVYKNRINNAKNPAALATLIKNVILTELNEFIVKDLSEVEYIGLETLECLKKEINELNKKLIEEKEKNNSKDINKKISNSKNELNNIINQKDKILSQLMKIGENFEYMNSDKEKKTLKLKQHNFDVINDELPKVGILYSNKKIKQVAIKYWNDLDLAIIEAERFNAEVVCEI